MSYLLQLAERLSFGTRHFPLECKTRHAEFVRSCQTPTGGFRGREGDADLYYTGFAVRALSLLREMDSASALRLAEYLRGFDPLTLDVIDLSSWLYSALVVQTVTGEDFMETLAADFSTQAVQQLESLRRPDGGYSKTADGAMGSTYHSFLAVLVMELLGQTPLFPNRLIQFLYDRQRDDGGFVEIDPMKRSGTNPTAAAVALLSILGAMDDDIRADVRHFLGQVWSNEGGFAANTRIPFPDGLSTFTALLTATDLGLPDLIRPTLLRRFVGELEFPTGGFRGATWDLQADVEYTFYGLGILALLPAGD